MEIDIDRDLCMGSGNCMYWAPGAFDLGDDGLAVVVEVDALSPDRLREAEHHCPTGAISVHDPADGG